MARQIEYLSLEELPKVPLVLEGVSSRFIRENWIIPLEFRDDALKVLIADPDNVAAIDALKVAIGSRIEICTSDPGIVEEYLNRFYAQEIQDFSKIIENIGDPDFEYISEEEEDAERLKDIASEAPIIRLVNLFITRAVEGRASDVHIEPYEGELKIRYRIDGLLYDIETAPKRLQAAIISRIKIMAKMNIAERRLPQDGRIRLRVSEREIDLRVSTIPVMHGESVVMRILDKGNVVINLDQLGFSTDNIESFHQLIIRPHGIILVTGPTGSGKTTTLYGALDRINSPDKKIITVEDPVEYQIRGINQIQVKPQIGLQFNNTLRHIVRQDPDIIMIGEIRDLEAADIAIQAALTGHLVFSTLHTNDAPSAITRLLDIGVEDFLLSSTIRGILAQRLVRVLCPNCREPDPEAINREEIKALGIDHRDVLYRGRGCEKCSRTGFLGRTGIFELLLVTDEIRRLINKLEDANQIRSVAREQGMRTLLEDGVRKVVEGKTTLEEVLRVTQEV